MVFPVCHNHRFHPTLLQMTKSLKWKRNRGRGGGSTCSISCHNYSNFVCFSWSSLRGTPDFWRFLAHANRYLCNMETTHVHQWAVARILSNPDPSQPPEQGQEADHQRGSPGYHTVDVQTIEAWSGVPRQCVGDQFCRERAGGLGQYHDPRAGEL